jgi:hypothetical protein
MGYNTFDRILRLLGETVRMLVAPFFADPADVYPTDHYPSLRYALADGSWWALVSSIAFIVGCAVWYPTAVLMPTMALLMLITSVDAIVFGKILMWRPLTEPIHKAEYAAVQSDEIVAFMKARRVYNGFRTVINMAALMFAWFAFEPMVFILLGFGLFMGMHIYGYYLILGEKLAKTRMSPWAGFTPAGTWWRITRNGETDTMPPGWMSGQAWIGFWIIVMVVTIQHYHRYFPIQF